MQNFKIDEFISGIPDKNAKFKRLSITLQIPKMQNPSNRKNLNGQDREKNSLNKSEEKSNHFTQEDIDRLWKVQEKKMKHIGGLTKLQKALKRTNLPPLATSIQNLRFHKLNLK